MNHYWSVGQPCPFVEKFNSIIPLLTDRRVLDAFFAPVLGETCAVPSALGVRNIWASIVKVL